MANRIRAHQTGSSTTVGSNSNSSISSSSSSLHSAPGAGAKRRRDVLQDISDEHSLNGGSARQQQQQQASEGSGRRAQHAPRRPSPMAPARRASVRRSRRLSEQQPSAGGGRGGSKTAAAAAAAGSNESRGGESEDGAGDGNDGMSCDEDLEGMVVDLSFEEVADDTVWRESGTTGDSFRHQSKAAVTAAAVAVAAAAAAAAGGGRGEVDGGVRGGRRAREKRGRDSISESSGRHDRSTSSSSSSSSDMSGTSRGKTEQGKGRKGGKVRHRVGSGSGTRNSREKEKMVSSSARRRIESGKARDGSRSTARTTSESADKVRSSRERREESLESETESSASSASVGRSVDPLSCHTPLAGGRGVFTSSAHEETERKTPSVKVEYLVADGVRTPLPAGVKDIDAGVQDERDSHLLNPDYLVEHAAYMRVQETRNRPVAYIGSRQKDMRQSMRSVLVDWIVEVCDQFKLSSRTLFQVVDLIDRSLSAFEVARGRLQLLGCACVVLASKFEEIYAPTAQELSHISDNTYTRGEIIAMELVVVNALQFRLSCVTPCNFENRFCLAAGSNARERSLVSYLSELLLQDYQGVTLLPSLKGAAALYLARQTLHPRGCPREAWTKQIEHYTGYGARALEQCVRRLHWLHVRAEANNLHAVRDKYKKSTLHRVAEVTCALEEALHFGGEEA